MMMREIDQEDDNNRNNNEMYASSSRCQDCGNQAKKECEYSRCRTCCKSKGFHCQTHIKSTWVPLYRRRQRQLLHQQQAQHFHSHFHHHNHLQTSSQTHQGLLLDDRQQCHDREGYKNKLPSDVSATATFRVVRVSPVIADDEGSPEQQYAYQTSVVIGGHVFKGILYDQGPLAQTANCGLVAPDQSSDHNQTSGLVFHQLHSFPNNNNNNNSIPLITARGGYEDQRPSFVGSESMFQPANFMSAGMQFFPNRDS